MSKESVDFHVKSDDYFGTIATVLGLVSEKLKKNKYKDVFKLVGILDNLEKDLIFLQGKYKIVKRQN